MVASIAAAAGRRTVPAVAGAIPFDPLFTLLMVLAAAVVVLVAGLLAYSLARARRAGAGPPRQDFGNRRLEIAWTAVPALVVGILFLLTLVIMRTTPTPGTDLPDGRPPDIVVVGHQWWWEIAYPQAGVVTANVLHLPAGRRVLVQLTSDDVQHDFWVPELGQKMDMYPGKTNYIWLEAEEPGLYRGVCAEFCGAQHAWMRILAVAQPEADFERWVAEQRTPPQPLAEPLAERGRAVYAARTCGSCHAIAGVSTGEAGPDLTHFGSRPTISAGVLVNTPENLARYLANPQAVKPGIYMPNFRLSDEEIAALVAYLEGLR